MNDIAITVKGLSKSYRMYPSPKERMKELLHPFGKKYHQDFWALKDVSFEVKKGDAVGIIGRNGSGKSTLLQILCGILQPTSGEVAVNGRISALLELGAGFNPQFTGRENVYMNGALMGFTKEEMDDRFDAIAGFAEIGEFIEQPVRTYSSGMFVRLAFAAAINVDPDILIVDEALSVGDELFQRKCFSRLEDIRKKGTTILFVSHSTGTVIDLCNRAALIDQGELLLTGKPKTVVTFYQKLIFSPAEKAESLRSEILALKLAGAEALPEAGHTAKASTIKEPDALEKAEKQNKSAGFYDPGLVPKSTVYFESMGAKISNPKITTLDGEMVNVLSRGGEYIYMYDVLFNESAYSVRCGMHVTTTSGFKLAGLGSHPEGDGIDFVEKGAVLQPRFRFKCIFLQGVYFIYSAVLGKKKDVQVFLHQVSDISMFKVQAEKGMTVYEVIDISSNKSDFVTVI